MCTPRRHLQNVARHLSHAALLVHERLADRPAEHRFQPLTRMAQDRLVQTEKLASLGQFTAGIAHEIKNPLNFVNNFSALSGDLIDELREAFAKATMDANLRAEVAELTEMLKGNLENRPRQGRDKRDAGKDRPDRCPQLAAPTLKTAEIRHSSRERLEPGFSPSASPSATDFLR